MQWSQATCMAQGEDPGTRVCMQAEGLSAIISKNPDDDGGMREPCRAHLREALAVVATSLAVTI